MVKIWVKEKLIVKHAQPFFRLQSADQHKISKQVLDTEGTAFQQLVHSGDFVFSSLVSVWTLV